MNRRATSENIAANSVNASISAMLHRHLWKPTISATMRSIAVQNAAQVNASKLMAVIVSAHEKALLDCSGRAVKIEMN
jgi:hypothetical protein